MKKVLIVVAILIVGILIGAFGSIMGFRHIRTRYKLEKPYDPPRESVIENISGIHVGGISFMQGSSFDNSVDHRILAKVRVETPARFPVIYVYDANSDGIPNSLSIWDSLYRNFTIVDRNSDGQWDSFEYSTGLSSNDVRYLDSDMDGDFDKTDARTELPFGEVWGK